MTDDEGRKMRILPAEFIILEVPSGPWVPLFSGL